MAKFRIILSFCAVVVLAREGCCLERITIRQFLAFLDRITLEYTDIYKSISNPNDVHFPDEIDIYKSPNFRECYDGIPYSVKSLLDGSKVTIRARQMKKENNTRTTNSPIKSPSFDSVTSDPPSLNTTTAPAITSSPSDESSSSSAVPIASSTYPSNDSTSPSSASSTSPSDITQNPSTVMRYSTSRIATDGTTSSSHITSSLPEFTTSVSHTMSTVTSETTTTTDAELDTDKLKVIGVLDDLSRFATTWAIPVKLFKFKLEFFDKRLNGNFPSTIAQKIYARVLARMVKVAKPIFRYRIDQIIADANRDLVTMQNDKTMRQVIQLLTAISMLPNIIHQSLMG